ncbi:MAG: alpha/beta fold hydrolase [Bernardetiaceae bacterium]|nr:alpha/beta fold hydrolase [Bernardetiaceae bacterium]
MIKKEITLKNPEGRAFALDYRYSETGLQPKPILIFVHGFKGFKDWGTFPLIADFFAKQDFIFLKLNFSYNGTTPDFPLDFVDLEAFGMNNFSRELADIQVVLDWLFGESNPLAIADRKRVFLMGHSRGASIALIKALEDERIKAAISLAAVSDLKSHYAAEELEAWKKEGVKFIHNGRTKQEMPMYYQFCEDFINNESRLDLLKAVEKAQKPILAFHGSEDPTLPPAMLEQIRAANPERVEAHLIEGTDHVFGGAHPYDKSEMPEALAQVCEQIHEFLIKN